MTDLDTGWVADMVRVEMDTPFRIVVFTGDLSWHVTATIRGVLDDNPDAELLVLNHSPKRSMRRLLRSQIRNVKKHGWRWIPYQGCELVSRVRASATPACPQRGLKQQLELRTHPNVTVESVPSINAPEVVERLCEWRPDLGLSLAPPILKEPLFMIPPLGTLNIHKGRLPDYRGMPPAFWEMWNREECVGVTIHRVDKGLDTGPILLSDEVPIEHYSTPGGLRVRLDTLGIGLMRRAVKDARAGKAVYRPQVGEGRTYTRPTLARERELARRLVRPDAKHVLKNYVLMGYSAATRLRPRNDPRIVVLLYHRVSDQLRDAVTIGIEQFDNQIQYLADYYEIVRLEDIVSGVARSGHGPVIAITFDDGYLDNYENAVPVLTKHNVPATFFVSTDHISSNTPFKHDLRKLGRGLPNMSWDQIREMKKEGFSFGSHTASHVNLAQINAELAQEELLRSRTTLERELGIERIMFAHPWGKRTDITPERLQQVQRAGYVCNCSAYGGVNRLPIDRWDIRRHPVNHQHNLLSLSAWMGT